MRRRNRRAGLTLYELLVVGSLLTLLSTALLEFSLRHTDLENLSLVQAELRTDAALALDGMLQELRHGTRAGATSPPNLTIPAAPNNTQLQLYLPVDADGNGLIVDAAGNLEWDTGTPIVYQYNAATRQLLRSAGATTRVLANHVTDVVFEDRTIDGALPADEVRIRLTLERTTRRGRSVNIGANTLVKLRN